MNLCKNVYSQTLAGRDHPVDVDTDVILPYKTDFKRKACVAVEWLYLLRNTEEFWNFWKLYRNVGFMQGKEFR
jgi:hypothetical protein